jgi:hypothetical protein
MRKRIIFYDEVTTFNVTPSTFFMSYSLKKLGIFSFSFFHINIYHDP